MFTPEGYWSWTEMIDATSLWTLAIVSAEIAPEFNFQEIEDTPYKCRRLLIERLASNSRVENAHEAWFAMDFLELWVLANFMDTYDAVLCSPDGRTLRCPPIIKAHGDAFDWWLWPLSKNKISDGEANTYFEGFRRDKFTITDARARFCAIDYDTGTIRLKPNTVKLLSSASYGHNGGDSNEDTLRFIDEQIRPIIGWSICWNANDVPATMKEIFDGLGFGDLDWTALFEKETSSQSLAKNGMHIIECVMAAFPDGKGDVTWSDVESRVGYSRRSIIRALKQSGLHSKWAATGQTQ